MVDILLQPTKLEATLATNPALLLPELEAQLQELEPLEPLEQPDINNTAALTGHRLTPVELLEEIPEQLVPATAVILQAAINKTNQNELIDL